VKVKSHGNKKLIKLLKELFPGYRIKAEYHIGERLKLDAYIKELNVGIEFDGIQHFERVEIFHETEDDFKRSKVRDKRKEELCEEQGITLVRIKYDEKLDEDLLLKKILESL
jgi:very-short-patch-repair endonuclease